MFFECLAHGALTIDGVFDAETMSDFVKHRIGKERIKGDMSTLAVVYELIRYRD